MNYTWPCIMWTVWARHFSTPYTWRHMWISIYISAFCLYCKWPWSRSPSKDTDLHQNMTLSCLFVINHLGTICESSLFTTIAKCHKNPYL